MKELVLLVLVAAQYSITHAQIIACREQRFDVVALVDGSGSIASADFQKIKNSLEMFPAFLGLSGTERRFGVAVFSSDVTVPIPLTSNVAALMSDIASLQQPNRNTNTALGLTRVIEEFENFGIPENEKFIIVITDGVSNNMAQTLAVAASAKNMGITVISVGVGGGINVQELTGIASDPSQVIIAEDFDQLTPKLVDVIAMVCNDPDIGPCFGCILRNGIGYLPTDDCDKFLQCQISHPPIVEQCPFGTHWDQSALTCNYIGQVNCPNGRCVGQSDGHRFKVSGNCSQYYECEDEVQKPRACDDGFSFDTTTLMCVADRDCTAQISACREQRFDVFALVDGSGSIASADFQKIKNSLEMFPAFLGLSGTERRFGVAVFSSDVTVPIPLTSNVAALMSDIASLQQPQGSTNTALGLTRVIEEFENFGIPENKKNIIVITDGDSNNMAQTLDVAASAKNMGISLIAVGVGGGVNVPELVGIASDPSKVIIAEDFDQLTPKLVDVIAMVCDDNCELIEDPINVCVFGQMVHGQQITQNCPVGLRFDKTTCGCTIRSPTCAPAPPTCQPMVDIDFETAEPGEYDNFGAVIDTAAGTAYFNGSTSIRILRLSNVDFRKNLAIKVSYRVDYSTPTQRTEEEAVVTNGDCGKLSTIEITRTGDDTNLRATTFDAASTRTTTELVIDTQEDWRDVKLFFDKAEAKLFGEVNGDTEEGGFVGPIIRSQCAFQLGRGEGINNFRGWIRYIIVTECDH
ncbi:hypothetical protein SNE40_003875 [Patella caerulea]|uniref:Uncharacterized protein n=1 Tax=Patella caerulea TaxID=87958 RepID=A0AAN8KCD9_PATCE